MCVAKSINMQIPTNMVLRKVNYPLDRAFVKLFKDVQ